MGPPPAGPRSPWPAAALAVGVAALVTGAAVYVARHARQLPREIAEQGREVLDGVRSVAEAFRTGRVTYAFASEAAQLNGSTRLQLATLRQVEVFERRDEAVLFWGRLQLPDVVVEARAPVEYVYYADLQKPWSFSLEGRRVQVRAPALEFNAPAIDASALRYVLREGSILRNEALAQERLRLGLTELAKTRARQNVALVRETARGQTERFVGTWLLRHFEDAQGHEVLVVFADERAPAPPTPVPPPSLGRAAGEKPGLPS